MQFSAKLSNLKQNVANKRFRHFKGLKDLFHEKYRFISENIEKMDFEKYILGLLKNI